MAENSIQMWTSATASLDWAKQRTLFDTLNLVKSGDIKVVYGHDEFKGSPCLINAIGCMAKSENESPYSNEPELVSAFDRICVYFHGVGVIEEQYVLNELAADILLRNFAPLKPVAAPQDMPYVEPRDADVAEAFQRLIDKPVNIDQQVE